MTSANVTNDFQQILRMLHDGLIVGIGTGLNNSKDCGSFLDTINPFSEISKEMRIRSRFAYTEVLPWLYLVCLLVA